MENEQIGLKFNISFSEDNFEKVCKFVHSKKLTNAMLADGLAFEEMVFVLQTFHDKLTEVAEVLEISYDPEKYIENNEEPEDSEDEEEF